MRAPRFRTPAATDVWNALQDTLVCDTHEHLRPIWALDPPVTLGRFLRYTYIPGLLRVSDGSPNGIGTKYEIDFATATIGAIAEALKRVRHSAFYRWLLAGIAEVHHLYEPLGGSEQDWRKVDELLTSAYGDPNWLSEGLSRAGIDLVVWDPAFRPGEYRVPDPRLVPSLRVDSMLASFHPAAHDHDGNNFVRDWAPEWDMSIATIGDVEALIDKVVGQNLLAGARSIKFAFAYDRSLHVGPPNRSLASQAMGQSPDLISPELRQTFGDYVVHHMLDIARQHGLVVQLHTGLADLSGSSPLTAQGLIEAYPEVTFDVFHGGYPWLRESAGLAYLFPNVRLNLTWLPQLSTEAAIATIREWFQIVPQDRRISWGGDAAVVEEAAGGLLATRYCLSRALGDLVADGDLELDEAIGLGRDVLFDAGREIYGLEVPAA